MISMIQGIIHLSGEMRNPLNYTTTHRIWTSIRTTILYPKALVTLIQNVGEATGNYCIHVYKYGEPNEYGISVYGSLAKRRKIIGFLVNSGFIEKPRFSIISVLYGISRDNYRRKVFVYDQKLRQWRYAVGEKNIRNLIADTYGTARIAFSTK